MKVSLICTVINEEKSIEDFLDSIKRQTREPDEIVIVDGGSTDRTLDILKGYKGLHIKLISAPGANISQGRNIAIAHAKHPVIASTDGGTRHDKNWLKYLLEPIERGEADVVAGLFFPDPKTPFEKVVGKMLYPNMNKVPDDWSPSARSMAYKKIVWKKVGGFPEELYTAEDAIFNHRAKEMAFRYKTARKSHAYWRPRSNIRKLFKQYYTYAKGNGESLLGLTHYPENRMTYLLNIYLILLVYLLLTDKNALMQILLYSISLAYVLSLIKLKNLRESIIGAMIIVVLAIANLLGFYNGILRRALGFVRPNKIKYIRILK